MKTHFLRGFTAFFLTTGSGLFGVESTKFEFAEIVTSKGTYSSEITKEIFKEVKPYLIPKSHLLKKQLDIICKKSRILSSYESLEKSGFKIIYRQLNRGLVVAKHPLLPGYLVKLYLDTSSRVE